MPSVSVGIIVPAGAAYDGRHHWRTETGARCASVRFDAGGYSSAHVQGPPAALRELAAALVDAADRAEADRADDPAAARVVEGVAQ